VHGGRGGEDCGGDDDTGDAGRDGGSSGGGGGSGGGTEMRFVEWVAAREFVKVETG
jgi:hypothetical protein